MGAPRAAAMAAAAAGSGADVHVARNQSADRRAAGADVDKFGVKPIFFKKTDFLGDPERRPCGSGRGVSNVEGFELPLLARYAEPKDDTTKKRDVILVVLNLIIAVVLTRSPFLARSNYR